MIASELNKLVVIEKETTSKNRVGTPEETYVFLKECWASKVTKGGTTQYNEHGEIPFTTTEFVFRFDERINYKCRIICDNNYFKIEHIDFIGRRHWIKVNVIDWDRAKQY